MEIKNTYVPPHLEVIDPQELIDKLSPVMSCSGFGGAVAGCN